MKSDYYWSPHSFIKSIVFNCAVIIISQYDIENLYFEKISVLNCVIISHELIIHRRRFSRFFFSKFYVYFSTLTPKTEKLLSNDVFFEIIIPLNPITFSSAVFFFYKCAVYSKLLLLFFNYNCFDIKFTISNNLHSTTRKIINRNLFNIIIIRGLGGIIYCLFIVDYSFFSKAFMICLSGGGGALKSPRCREVCGPSTLYASVIILTIVIHVKFSTLPKLKVWFAAIDRSPIKRIKMAVLVLLRINWCWSRMVRND